MAKVPKTPPMAPNGMPPQQPPKVPGKPPVANVSDENPPKPGAKKPKKRS